VLKAAGILYAVATAAAMGFLLPDTLSVWAPTVSALDLVEQTLLPALAALTAARVLFQDVPTRGAEAFLLLPVHRSRIARAVGIRASLSVFNLAPLAFVVPFATRTVRAEHGIAGAVGFVVGAVALVALSHVAVILWKTRLGPAPFSTVAVVAASLGGAAAVLSLAGGLTGANAPLGIALVASIAVALGLYAHRGVVGALYLDPPDRTSRSAPTPSTGFERAGLRAFLDLEWRLVVRTRFPRGIALNALAMTVVIASFAFVWGEATPTVLLLLFSTGTLAISAGQFALPFASGHYDRLLTLPDAPRHFVAAKLMVTAGSTVVLGAVQLGLALALAPDAWPALGGAVLFCAGVLAPVAVLGSTFAPKPFDVDDKFLGNARIQSLPPQIAIALAGGIAVALIAVLDPEVGLAATAAIGAVGVAALPLWARLIEGRVVRRRYAVAERFRSVL